VLAAPETTQPAGKGGMRKGTGTVVCLLAVCAEFKVHARDGSTEAMREVWGAGERRGTPITESVTACSIGWASSGCCTASDLPHLAP
jgi:hypothetical protein